MQTNWINGTIAPPESGEYYVIIEAQFDNETVKKGDIEMTTDYYNTSTDTFDSIGDRNNPYWKVLSWATIKFPAIPKDLQGKVKNYFGHTVDVVEVVRCKDCKHFMTDTFKRTMCNRTFTMFEMNENDFCSYGERKEGAMNDD